MVLVVVPIVALAFLAPVRIAAQPREAVGAAVHVLAPKVILRMQPSRMIPADDDATPLEEVQAYASIAEQAAALTIELRERRAKQAAVDAREAAKKAFVDKEPAATEVISSPLTSASGGAARPERWKRPSLKKAYRLLVTREDSFSAHKLLGSFCVVHTAFRLARVGPADMGFGPTLTTLACISVHGALSLSSFLFRIPLQRRGGALSYGMWTEYRLQSIIFTLRSLAMMVLICVEGVLGLRPNYYVNAAILFASMAASDVCSRSVGAKGRSRTVRDLDAPHATRLLFSIMQIQTSSALLLGQRRFSMHFIFVLVMQFNAFLMTLRRKKLVPYRAAVTIYAAMTVIGSSIVFYETSISQPGLFLVGNTLGNTAAALRIGCSAPKYLLWLLMAVVTHFARQTLPPPMGLLQPGAQSFAYWPALAILSNLVILAVGWRTRPASASGQTT